MPSVHFDGGFAGYTKVARADVNLVELPESVSFPALLSLRTRGRHLRLGASNKEEQGQIELPVDVILFRELSVIGSFGMQAARFPEMLRMVQAGKLNPELLLRETVDLEDAGDVLASMADYETIGVTVITGF